MAATGFLEYYVQLFDTRARGYINDSTGVAVAMTANTATKATLFTDDRGTTLANPMTFTSGVLRFFVADTVTTVDLSLLTANGHALFVKGLTPSQHRLDIEPERITQKLAIPYVHTATLTATVQDTSFRLSASMLVKDVELDITTLSTLGVMNVGTSTTPSGFVALATIATTGLQALLLQEDIVSAVTFYGTLLASATGTVRKKHIRANATSGASIVYNNVTSAAATGDGFIYLSFDRIPSRAT